MKMRYLSKYLELFLQRKFSQTTKEKMVETMKAMELQANPKKQSYKR